MLKYRDNKMTLNSNGCFKKSFGYTCLNEIIHKDKLEYILKNWKLFEKQLNSDSWDIDYNPKTLLSKYFNKYKDSNIIAIKYKKTDKYATSIGRYFCNSGLGIQSLPRKIRHTICKGLYIDLDFKNAHPVILKQLCDTYDIKCPNLTTYVNNREEILNMISKSLNIALADAKFIFLKALNGNKTTYDIQNWFSTLEEFNNIHSHISNLEEFKTIREEVINESIENVDARVVNRILCSFECDCLESLFKILDKNKCFDYYSQEQNKIYKVCSLIFDGLQVLDNASNRKLINQEFLTSLSSAIKLETGFSLEVVIKEFDECLEIPSDYSIMNKGNNTISSDTEARDYVLSIYGKYYIKCCNVRYVKYNNIWTSNPDVVEEVITNHIINCNLQMELGEGKYKNYSGFKSHISSCYKLILSTGFQTQNDFIKNNLNKGKYYLPFKDCVFSFIDGKTYSYDDLNICFTQQINRNFPKYVAEDYEELLRRVINPIYPNEDERDYNAHIKARAIAGCFEDKKWYCFIGERNCGKGVETTLLRNAFDVFVRTFDAKTLIHNKYGNPTSETALAWVVNKKEARLIISNEIKGDENTKLNGNFIKTLASGGDEMVGRRLYENEVEFIPQFTMILCCNNIYETTPKDALENLEAFEYKSKFVVKEEMEEGISYYKLRDESIKSFIQEDRIIDAYTWYIFNQFSMNRKPTPENVKLTTDINVDDDKLSVDKFICKNFITTEDKKNDRLFTEEICDILNNYGYKVNLIETGKYLIRLNIGIHNKKTNKNGERKNGFECIRFNPPKDEDTIINE